MLTAIGEEVVLQSVCLAVPHFVAVALVHLLVVESLGVRQPDLRSFSAGGGEDGVGCRERFPIEENVKTGSRRQRQRLLGKGARIRLIAGCGADSNNFSRAGGRVLHMSK